MKKFLLAIVLAVLFQPFASFSQSAWTVYEYSITFKIKNAGLTVNGKFSGLKMEILFGPDKLSASKISGSVDASTLVTGINKRDNSIKDDKYLDAEHHKLIEATSTKIYTKDADYAGMFNIAIKGITKEIEIPFKFTPLGNLAEFDGEFTLNRKDFGVGGGSMTMADNLKVHIVIKAKMQS
jgi:polyisoprenoid-binding protein YceI